jgi:C-terminal processing protease CtpA/Prc
MRNTNLRIAIAACAAVLALATAVAGEGDKKCTGTTQDCLDYMAANLKERGWVGVEMDAAEHGYHAVARVVEDSPAERAGMQVGDVLIAINGIDLAEADKATWHGLQAEMKPGKTIRYTVERKGREINVAVELGRVPDAVLAQWVGNHMLEHATVALAKN